MTMEQLKKLIQNPKYTKKKMKLVDGRNLSYSECGNIKSGMPVLFCFGLMTSSVAIMFAHHVALQNNLRILAVDYPGIGESTFQEDRTLGGWADDMNQFCDQVLGKYSKVRLLGHSLGGLHVLALLSDKTFKARVNRTVLLCPWLYIEGDQFSPTWMKVARGLPDVFQSSIIPRVLTNLSSGSIQLVGWSNPQHTPFQAANIVTSYGMLQGQAGNEQMVRLALSKSDTYLPQDLETPVIIYHGTQDKLILENSILELVRQLKDRNCSGVKFVSVPDADHNTIMAHPANLGKVMSSLVGDADKWAAEIFKSLGRQSRSMQDLRRTKSPPTSPDQNRPKSRSMPGRTH